MPKINASLSITRDGIASVTPMTDISYGKLVAVELALSVAQVQLCGLAVGKMAGLEGHGASKGPWGSDLSVNFEVDFEGGGSSSFSADHRGLTAAEADEIQGLYEACVAG